MNDIVIRSATADDISFLVDAVIEAEKSGTDKFSYTTLFNLSEGDVRKYITNIFEEEINNLEFSVSSFIIAEHENKIVAAVAGWLEGKNENNLTSSILKANLICYCFPRESIVFANSKNDIIKGTHIEREIDKYQIEFVYTLKEYRGNNLFGTILKAHKERCRNLLCNNIQIHVFSNNESVIRYYQKIGFTIVKSYVSDHKEVTNYLPSNEKILMEMSINNN